MSSEGPSVAEEFALRCQRERPVTTAADTVGRVVPTAMTAEAIEVALLEVRLRGATTETTDEMTEKTTGENVIPGLRQWIISLPIVMFWNVFVN